MANLGLPVPPGFYDSDFSLHVFFTRTTILSEGIEGTGRKGAGPGRQDRRQGFGDSKNPLLVSVRSGGRASMPGMMDTVLNLGLNDVTVEALAAMSGDRRFAYDSYRRFITMYSDVVLGFEHHHFEDILDTFKDSQGYTLDTDLTGDDWVDLVGPTRTGGARNRQGFPAGSPCAIMGRDGAVFSSWMNARAVTYRRLHDIPESWGTAVNVQAMVFGNMGEDLGDRRGLHPQSSTGESKLYGEF